MQGRAARRTETHIRSSGNHDTFSSPPCLLLYKSSTLITNHHAGTRRLTERKLIFKVQEITLIYDSRIRSFNVDASAINILLNRIIHKRRDSVGEAFSVGDPVSKKVFHNME